MHRWRRTRVPLPDGASMPMVVLGDGTPVVYLPGAGDGLSTVYDAAPGIAWTFRARSHRHRMHVLSRREPIPEGHGVAGHARDVIAAIERLGIGPVVLECNSAGGPVGQLVAARRPDLVRALVLASTGHRVDGAAAERIERWLEMVRGRRWAEFAWDTAQVTYRWPGRFAWARWMVAPPLGSLSRPRDPDRIERILSELLGIDHTQELGGIRCPTLVFAGALDPLFPPEVQREMAALIPRARLVLAPGLLHGADLESREYAPAVDDLIAAIAR
ncbi:alpha/beta fold hydrolase [Agrococcus sp. HG114]|uniref:alpha/beta fold hydrolase n=1 Tax=Agrococcus sp. HG114 TaxID=2969757 RepID=UPI00215AEF2C|nr:alpha/beta hydrolase [Agrococcus sp. HG114]MCR8670487.1 alpha/beta hydrolase [Agrococcus sp. HG114]